MLFYVVNQCPQHILINAGISIFCLQERMQRLSYQNQSQTNRASQDTFHQNLVVDAVTQLLRSVLDYITRYFPLESSGRCSDSVTEISSRLHHKILSTRIQWSMQRLSYQNQSQTNRASQDTFHQNLVVDTVTQLLESISN